ncbi:MAG: flagellar hook assembly protein FlgD [Thermotogae bacterium]|nr:flagellar hook assembly protein FlgD [Thermotogaceae bacterium]RKX34670.1 MAG: flagellar hook assembly protein FlgD [Thermotogota bacterium]
MINAIDYNNLYGNTLDGLRQREPKSQLDKDAFLLLLVTEMRNQNPLEPMDNKDFIAQLTQFSSLEQITNMTKAFENFLSLQQGSLQAQASSLIGKYAVVRSNSVQVNNGVAESIVFTLDENAPVTIRIYDENGSLVREVTSNMLESGAHSFTWDGRNSDGLPVPDGNYSYTVSKIQPDGSEVEIGGIEGGVVQGVQFKDNNIYVIINDILYPLASVVEISEVEGDNT